MLLLILDLLNSLGGVSEQQTILLGKTTTIGAFQRNVPTANPSSRAIIKQLLPCRYLLLHLKLLQGAWFLESALKFSLGFLTSQCT